MHQYSRTNPDDGLSPVVVVAGIAALAGIGYLVFRKKDSATTSAGSAAGSGGGVQPTQQGEQADPNLMVLRPDLYSLVDTSAGSGSGGGATLFNPNLLTLVNPVAPGGGGATPAGPVPARIGNDIGNTEFPMDTSRAVVPSVLSTAAQHCALSVSGHSYDVTMHWLQSGEPDMAASTVVGTGDVTCLSQFLHDYAWIPPWSGMITYVETVHVEYP